jgi:LPXTG-motif cell wall-anchored protein
VEVGGESEQIDLAAVGLGVAAGVSLFLKNFKRTPPAASCGVLS